MEGFNQPVFVNFRELDPNREEPDYGVSYWVRKKGERRFLCLWCRQSSIKDRTLHNINVHKMGPAIYDPLMVMLETVEALWGEGNAR
jgi:hypothetical protein